VPYDPEPYWDRVASEIQRRGPGNFVAGDDDPYARYKRQKCLRVFLGTLNFDSKVVLEVGSGPGGNLLHVLQAGASRVIGADVSGAMLDLSAKALEGRRDAVELHKIDGGRLPLNDKTVDLTFTVTVLQHVTGAATFQALVGEMCRVTRGAVVVVEDTGAERPASVGGGYLVRTVHAYEVECRKHGFQLIDRRYLGLRASRSAYALARRLFVSSDHTEGARHDAGAAAGMRLLLALARPLDALIEDHGDLTRMVFCGDRSAPG